MVSDAEWLNGMVETLEIMVYEDDEESLDFLELDTLLSEWEQMAHTALSRSSDGIRFKQLLIEGAPKFAAMFPNAKAPWASYPESHWWWYLPEIAAGRMAKPPI